MPDNERAERGKAMDHLALVRSLSGEMSAAISAIEHNDMGEFAAHVAAQEAICHKLKQDTDQALRVVDESYQAASKDPADSRLFEKIREAHLALAQLNRTYSALIQRSQKSIGAIIGLYRNHGQRYSKDQNPQPSAHTWSCEA